MSPTTRFLIVSLLFHLLYTTSIFDIYFTSPVVHPSRRYSASNALAFSTLSGREAADHDREQAVTRRTPPADRLVLIVGDGLRADTLFKAHSADMLPPWAVSPFDAATALAPQKNWSAAGTDHDASLSKESFYAAPHLRRAALERGAWGISHTRVPTESRPGHVALIAGMYEDVSAVTKGWKQNPIPFDSVFNQSEHTFSFGSPDILPMFATGAVPGRVDMESYGEQEEDFTADASDLDLWVLDRVKALLARSKTDRALDRQLRAPGTVFFLHLLGLDTTGHTYRPKSQEYVGNLMVVDAIVAEVERLFEEFYGEDNKRTAYLFSADHGMSNKGNHGDGEPDNTRTPVVTWGAGLRGPRAGNSAQAWREKQRNKDEYYQGWGELDTLWRTDVAQADLTPLMAATLGLHMPANSEGKLPLNYMQIPKEEAALASMANALEVLEMYTVKHDERKKRMLRYAPFSKLRAKDHAAPGSDAVAEIKASIERKEYDLATEKCAQLIDTAVEGSRYLQTYDWLMLVSIVVVGYLGSMGYSAAFLLKHYVVSRQDLGKSSSASQRVGRIAVASILALLYSKFIAERSPWTYYSYAAFAAFYWMRIADESHAFVAAWRNATISFATSQHRMAHSTRWLWASILLRLVLTLAALELMVLGYLHRIAWSAGFVVIGFLWPAAGIMADVKSRHEILIILWTICCGACGCFTISSLEKEESIPFLVSSGLVFMIAGVCIVSFPNAFLGHDQALQSAQQGGSATSRGHRQRTMRTIALQLAILFVSTLVTAASSASLQQKSGLPRLNQVTAWLVLALCLSVPFWYGLQRRRGKDAALQDPQPSSQRLAIVTFAFAPIFVLLSIRDETLFFGCYTLTLLVWAKLEGSLYEERAYGHNSQAYAIERRPTTNGANTHKDATYAPELTRPLQKEDIRVAVFFLFFLHVGFFGTGNVASISSFYLSPVYRLVPIFSPFLMAALLILKILVPFVILASVLQQLCLTPPHKGRIDGTKQRKTGAELAGPPLLGHDSVGGLGLPDAYAIVLLACLLTDVLALNFLITVRTEGSWLEIGRSITHFAMSNLLQVFMLALSAIADAVVG